MSTIEYTVTVTNGPSAWAGKTGLLIKMDGDFCIVRIEGKDDVGVTTYDVRMPIGFVDFPGEKDVKALGPVSK
jgi:hypothetical protein